MDINYTRFRGIIAGILVLGICYMPMQIMAQADESDDYMEVGGAVRFNLFHEDYGAAASPNNTQFTLDTWRINFRGQSSEVGINFEYRFYPTFNTHFIKQGWLDYNFSDQTELQVGITQVPFGNLQYNSHNWWFQGPYYVGLEDDHDMGFKLTYQNDNWDLMAAYFVQPEPAGPAYGSALSVLGAQEDTLMTSSLLPATNHGIMYLAIMKRHNLTTRKTSSIYGTPTISIMGTETIPG